MGAEDKEAKYALTEHEATETENDDGKLISREKGINEKKLNIANKNNEVEEVAEENKNAALNEEGSEDVTGDNDKFVGETFVCLLYFEILSKIYH